MSVLNRFGRLATAFGVVTFALTGVGQETGGFREISYPTADGGVIFGNLYGEGPHAVLLGHGAVFDKESWDDLARRLAAEGHQALAVDFRGYGKSRAGRSRGGLHEDIIGGIRYLSERGATRVSVIGASMGVVRSAMRSRSSTRVKSTASSCWPLLRPALRSDCRVESYSSSPRATRRGRRWRGSSRQRASRSSSLCFPVTLMHSISSERITAKN